VTNQGGQAVPVADRDPNRFPVPIIGVLAPGESLAAEFTVSRDEPRWVFVSADGGRTTAVARAGR
jgi:hypothetical protein